MFLFALVSITAKCHNSLTNVMKIVLETQKTLYLTEHFTKCLISTREPMALSLSLSAFFIDCQRETLFVSRSAAVFPHWHPNRLPTIRPTPSAPSMWAKRSPMMTARRRCVGCALVRQAEPSAGTDRAHGIGGSAGCQLAARH